MKSYKLYTMAIFLIGSEMFVIQCHKSIFPHKATMNLVLNNKTSTFSHPYCIYEKSHSRVLDEVIKAEVKF